MMTLFAFIKRKEGMSREAFYEHWHAVHGPMIRDTPELNRWLLRYEQHPARAGTPGDYDGVAVQTYRSWEEFVEMLSTPEAKRMEADEREFIAYQDISVVFCDEPQVMIAGPDSRP